MDPFTNPYIVGTGFIIIGIINYVVRGRIGKRLLFDKKSSDRTNRRTSLIMTTLLMLLGVFLLIREVFYKAD